MNHHHFVGHSLVAYDDLVRVPLIVRYPRLYPEGKRVVTPVSTRRAFHSALEAAGVYAVSNRDDRTKCAPVDVRGLSLARTVDGPDPEDGLVFTEAYTPDTLIAIMENDDPEAIETFRCCQMRRAVYRDDYKLITVGDGPDELFDVIRDPGELSNLIGDRPEVTAEMGRPRDYDSRRTRNWPSACGGWDTWGSEEETVSRRDDLDNHIRASYKLILDYEAIIQTASGRPEEKLRAQRIVREQWLLIEGYWEEYRTLAGGALPADIAEITARFSEGSSTSAPAPEADGQRSVDLPPEGGQPATGPGGAARWQPYRDFVLKIERADEDTYRVEASGPTGEASTTFALPFDEKDLKIFRLEVGRPPGRLVRGHIPQPMRQTVDFGGQLYDAVLSGLVRDRFVSARHEALQGGYGLRIKLRLADAPELADLTWEYLYDGHDFVALSVDTPLVRYLDLPRPPRAMHCALPLRILVTISSPHGLPQLDVQAEEDKVREALAEMAADGTVEIDVRAEATLRALQRTLRRARRGGRPYHVWHYVGHGAFNPAAGASELMFCDEAGMPSAVGGFQLGTLFNSFPEMRLALLNACEGARVDPHDPFAGVAAALVERGVPAVIGMQFPISDRAAVTFGEEFYAALVDGLPVDAAVAEARRAIFFMPNWVEWAHPVLYMRAPDGVLFDIGERATGSRKQTGDTQRAPARARREERDEARRGAREDVERLERGREEGQVKAWPRTLTLRKPFEPEMILIPAGRFLMGSDPAKDGLAQDDEQPQHTLHLPDYYISKAPVTNARYLPFVRDARHRIPEHWTKKKRPRKGKEDHPVVYVSWSDAVAYCRWLAEATGRPYHLPSEAEWEKAARGAEGRIYPWGNEWDASWCNSREGGVRHTTPVYAYAQGASPDGVLDMAGNVWEWTRSLWGTDIFKPAFAYPYDPTDGRENLDAGDDVRRVVRGGSFDVARDDSRCSVRFRSHPRARLVVSGFRVVVSPISSSAL
jgi:formylglycine-generating enzyme required for sulfatase activity